MKQSVVRRLIHTLQQEQAQSSSTTSSADVFPYVLSPCGGWRHVVPYHELQLTHPKGRWKGTLFQDVLLHYFTPSLPLAHYRRAIKCGHLALLKSSQRTTSRKEEKKKQQNCPDVGSAILTESEVEEMLHTACSPTHHTIHHMNHIHEVAVPHRPLKIVDMQYDGRTDIEHGSGGSGRRDDILLVVDKPAGLPSVPSGRYRRNSAMWLLNFFCHQATLGTSSSLRCHENRERDAPHALQPTLSHLVDGGYVSIASPALQKDLLDVISNAVIMKETHNTLSDSAKAPPTFFNACHRLDRVTSGVLLFKHHRPRHQGQEVPVATSPLSSPSATTIANRMKCKLYLALVKGQFNSTSNGDTRSSSHTTSSSIIIITLPEEVQNTMDALQQQQLLDCGGCCGEVKANEWIEIDEDVGVVCKREYLYGTKKTADSWRKKKQAEVRDEEKDKRNDEDKWKHAHSRFQHLRYDADRDISLVLCWPVTGRTHQLRVHLQHLGHPIVGDAKYDFLHPSDRRSLREVMSGRKQDIEIHNAQATAAQKPPKHKEELDFDERSGALMLPPQHPRYDPHCGICIGDTPTLRTHQDSGSSEIALHALAYSIGGGGGCGGVPQRDTAHCRVDIPWWAASL